MYLALQLAGYGLAAVALYAYVCVLFRRELLDQLDAIRVRFDVGSCGRQ